MAVFTDDIYVAIRHKKTLLIKSGEKGARHYNQEEITIKRWAQINATHEYSLMKFLD